MSEETERIEKLLIDLQAFADTVTLIAIGLTAVIIALAAWHMHINK